MSDFEKVTAYLFSLENKNVGLFPFNLLGEWVMRLLDADKPWFEQSKPQVPEEITNIVELWQDNEQAAFLIYFGNECMKRLDE